MVRLRLISALVLMTSLLCDITIGYPDGGGDEACDDMIPQHVPNVPQAGDGPYNIIVTPNVGGVRIRVQRTGGGSNRFRGICIQVHLEGDTVPFQQEGQFDAPPNGFQYMGCGNGDQAITHTNNNRKTSVTVDWTPSFSGRYVVAVTVDLSFETFWLMQSDAFDVEAPTPPTTTTQPTTTIIPVDCPWPMPPFNPTCDADSGSDDICAANNRFGASCTNGPAVNTRQKTRCCPGQICDSSAAFDVFDCPTYFCVVIDGSDSVTRARFASVTAALHQWIDITHVARGAVSWSYVTFSSDVDSAIPLRPFRTAEDLEDATVNELIRGGGRTFADLGVERCREMMADACASADQFPGIIIIITDGNSNDQARTRQQIEDSIAEGVNVFVITIGDEDDYDDINEYLDIVGAAWTDHVPTFADLESSAVELFGNLPGCPSCGDGIQDPGEGCDDGNNDDNDGCSAGCVVEFCGDGITQTEEECDDGNTDPNDGCDANCVVEFCGDGVQQPGENCDGSAGCRADCTECGDGEVNGAEDCDDGNNNDNDNCRNDCTRPFCGDGQVDAGEECDRPNNCRDDCTIPRCGDGIRDQGEACDDGNNDNFDGCRNTCVLPRCGDGIVDAGEECDSNADDCTNCRIAVVGPCDGCKIINGVGFNPSSNCGCFLTCLFAADGGLIEFVERPCEPLFWDQELLTCVTVNQTQCPNDPCANQGTQYWGMKCCAGGWLCDSGRTIAPILCEIGQRFNANNGQCTDDDTCEDICIEPNTNECYLIANENDPSGRTYFAPQLLQDGNETLILMTCAVNTAFNQEECVCSDLTTEEPVCVRDYLMNFEQDPVEDTFNSAYIRNEFVAINTGEGYGTFSATDMTKLIVPRYANEDWRDQWMIVATFDTMGNSNPDGPVFSNSGCMAGVSIEIAVVGNEIVVTVVTSDATQVVRFPTRTGITTVTVTYDGTNLKLDVEYANSADETQTVPLTGWVTRRPCAVQWGYGYNGRHFNGRIYFGDIWLCLPGTRGF